MKRKAIFLTGFILLAMILAFIYLKTTPYYSIYLFARAVGNHDAETALQYVDVDSIAESLAKNLASGDGASTKVNKGIASAISANMPSVKEGLRSYFMSVIRSQGGIPSGKAGGGISFGNLSIHDVHAGIIWHLDVQREGDTAYVRIRNKPGGSAKMIRTNEGYWKFNEILIDRPTKE
jgi:hypothetical protein